MTTLSNMSARDAKILALSYLQEWAWDMKHYTACVDYTTSKKDAEKLAVAFEDLGMELYTRVERLKNRA